MYSYMYVDTCRAESYTCISEVRKSSYVHNLYMCLCVTCTHNIMLHSFSIMIAKLIEDYQYVHAT